MKISFAISVLVVGLGLAGCGEPIPSVSESTDLPKATPANGSSPDTTEKTVVPGPNTKSAVFQAGDSTQRQDFLFVFDDSGSMTDEVNEVKGELSNFFSALNARRSVNFQVAVTTTNAWFDEGQLYASSGGYDVLTRNTPNVVAEFGSTLETIKSNIMNSQNRINSGMEMGWMASQLAIDLHGQQFMRDGVPLAVVVLSDATDTSRRCFLGFFGMRCDNEPVSVRHYVDYFKGLRNSRDVATKVLLYPLAAHSGLECNSLEGQEADWPLLGARYREVQQGVGTGFTGSICSGELRSNLSEIGRQISSRGICYDLTGGPVKILEVTVSGTVVPSDSANGYQFDSSTGSVCFPGMFQPTTGASIRVSYAVAP